MEASKITGTDPQDVAECDWENKQNELEFKQELTRYSNRKQQYEENKLKAYALIRERCTEAMIIKIESRHDFETKILDNPIELLLAIKQHSLNYQEYRYNMSILADSFKNLMTTKQKEGENLCGIREAIQDGNGDPGVPSWGPHGSAIGGETTPGLRR